MNRKSFAHAYFVKTTYLTVLSPQKVHVYVLPTTATLHYCLLVLCLLEQDLLLVHPLYPNLYHLLHLRLVLQTQYGPVPVPQQPSRYVLLVVEGPYAVVHFLVQVENGLPL